MNAYNHNNTQSCCHNKSGAESRKDPVCGMTVPEEDDSLRYDYKGTGYFFCSPHCLETFKKDPGKFSA